MQFADFTAIILGDSSKIRAVKHLLKQPDGLNGRELGRLIGVSHSKAHSLLRELSAQGIVRLRRIGGINIYTLNSEHFIVELLKPFFEAEREIFRMIGKDLFSKLDPKPLALILHGSMVRGEERPTSDIDILAVYDDADFRDDLTDQILDKSIDTTTRFGNTSSAIAVSLSRFREGIRTKGSLFYNVFKEGKSIAGLTMLDLIGYGRSETQNNGSSKISV